MLRQKKPTKAPPPDPTKFDTWDAGQVFDVLETSVGNSGQWIHGYRTMPEMREDYLHMLDTDLKQAIAAAQSLRRRL